MKIQCDVCESAIASLICCADEAALCADCDTRIHAANKLASKHQRVPLLAPASQPPPRCDVCQERSAYFFCLEDRAFLCRECDVSIHTANARAANHQRFLVTGVRVALHAINHQEPAPEQALPNKSSRKVAAFNGKAAPKSKKPASKTAARSKPSKPSVSLANAPPSVTVRSPASTYHLNPISSNRRHLVVPALTTLSGGSHFDPGLVYKRSSITEYLTEGIPGWRLDELFGLTDLTEVHSFEEAPSSKADVPKHGDLEAWAFEMKLFDEEVDTECPAEVPQLPSPPTASGL